MKAVQALDKKPLWIIAVDQEMYELLPDFKKGGADLNVVFENDTPLLDALNSGNSDVAFALIDAHAGINVSGSHGYTPLMEAAEDGKNDLVKKLLAAKANVFAKDENGRTARDIAARHHPDTAGLLKAAEDQAGIGAKK